MSPEQKVTIRIVRCPNCGKSAKYDQSNSARPFCSQRCKTMDIARWAEESYKIPAKESSPSEHDGDEEFLRGLNDDEDDRK